MALRIRYYFLLLVLGLTTSVCSVAQNDAPVVDTSVTVEESVTPIESDDDDDDAVYRGKIEVYEAPVFRQTPDTVTERLKKDEDFRYANDPAYWVKEKKKERSSSDSSFNSRFYDFFQGNGVRTVMFILLAALLIFVVYRVVVVNKLYMAYASKRIHDEDDADGEMAQDDLENRIQQAVAAKQYRDAVRYLYLKTLRVMSDKGLIQLRAKATNYDYMSQMSGHARAEEFGFLTRVYDYVWYGEFTLTDEQFNLVHTSFKNFFHAI